MKKINILLIMFFLISLLSISGCASTSDRGLASTPEDEGKVKYHEYFRENDKFDNER